MSDEWTLPPWAEPDATFVGYVAPVIRCADCGELRRGYSRKPQHCNEDGAPLCYRCDYRRHGGARYLLCLACHRPHPADEHREDLGVNRTRCPDCRTPAPAPERVGECGHCGADITAGRRGPMPTYCSPACRQAAYRARKTTQVHDDINGPTPSPASAPATN